MSCSKFSSARHINNTFLEINTSATSYTKYLLNSNVIKFFQSLLFHVNHHKLIIWQRNNVIFWFDKAKAFYTILYCTVILAPPCPKVHELLYVIYEWVEIYNLTISCNEEIILLQGVVVMVLSFPFPSIWSFYFPM